MITALTLDISLCHLPEHYSISSVQFPHFIWSLSVSFIMVYSRSFSIQISFPISFHPPCLTSNFLGSIIQFFLQRVITLRRVIFLSPLKGHGVIYERAALNISLSFMLGWFYFDRNLKICSVQVCYLVMFCWLWSCSDFCNFCLSSLLADKEKLVVGTTEGKNFYFEFWCVPRSWCFSLAIFLDLIVL